MLKGNKGNKIYILTVEFNPETEEIEFIAEEVIDNKDYLTHVMGAIDLEENGWDIESLEYMREHYISGEA